MHEDSKRCSGRQLPEGNEWITLFWRGLTTLGAGATLGGVSKAR
jgi:hypothetical protein